MSDSKKKVPIEQQSTQGLNLVNLEKKTDKGVQPATAWEGTEAYDRLIKAGFKPVASKATAKEEPKNEDKGGSDSPPKK